MTIIIRRPWTQQPSNGGRIAEASALSAGLVYAAAYPTVIVGEQRRTEYVSVGSNCTVVGNALSFVNSGTKTSAGSGSKLAGATQFTAIAVVTPSATIGTRNAFLYLGNDTASQQFGIGTGYGSSSNLMMMQGNGSAWCVSNATTFFAAGVTCVVGVAFNDAWGAGLAKIKAIHNGRAFAFNENGPFSSSPTTADAVVSPGGLPGNGNIGGWEGAVHGVFLWNRALADSEIAALGRNPWQLFAPRRVVIPVAGAASLYPTLSSLSAINVTSSSAQPRLTYTF